MQITLKIENMSCGACVRRVSQTLNAMPETRAEEVRLGSARVETSGSADDIVAALAGAGFPAHVTPGGA